MRQQDVYPTNAGVQLKYVQHRATFSRATSPSLIVCQIHLAYSKLLKLTAASNAGGARRISGRSLLIVTCDHHLDDRLSLYHVSSDRIGSINNIQ